MDDSADATPRQSSRAQGKLGEEGLDGTLAAAARQNLAPLLVRSMPENERREASPHSETTPSGGENGGSSGSGLTTSDAPAKNKELVRVVEQDVPAPAPPAKRQRSPYVKWNKEEDDLLAQVRRRFAASAHAMLTKERT